MRKVGIKALKNGLSGYIRAVAAGETVLVTDRDRVVAELGPPRAPAEGTEEERGWAELIRLGVVTPAGYRPKRPCRRAERRSCRSRKCWHDLDEGRSDD